MKEFFNNLAKSVHNTKNKIAFGAKQHAPELELGLGIIGIGVGMFLCVKESFKAKDILEESNKKLEELHVETPVYADNEVIGTAIEVPEENKKAVTKVYLHTALDIVKTYAPSIIITGLSITSILTSHKTLRDRNTSLAAAYAVVDGCFKRYRKNVVDRFGETVDKELRYDIRPEKVVVEEVDEKTGEVTMKEIEERVPHCTGWSDYARFFDETCPDWTKSPACNLTYINKIQDFCNDQLKARGYFFLNEAYRALGIPETKAGQIVGWIYRPGDPNHKGDNFIDFGVDDGDTLMKRMFLEGKERSILLDFNVDGPILDYILEDI